MPIQVTEEDGTALVDEDGEPVMERDCYRKTNRGTKGVRTMALSDEDMIVGVRQIPDLSDQLFMLTGSGMNHTGYIWTIDTTDPTNNLDQRSPTTHKSCNRYQTAAAQDHLIRSISPIEVCLATQKNKSVTNLTKQGVGELINCAGQTDSLFDRFAIPGHLSF